MGIVTLLVLLIVPLFVVSGAEKPAVYIPNPQTQYARALPKERKDPAGNETQSTYDALNRMIKTTDALGSSEERTYDTAGRALSPMPKTPKEAKEQKNSVFCQYTIFQKQLCDEGDEWVLQWHE